MRNKGPTYWVISDTHFGHKAIQEYEDRPQYFELEILKRIKALEEGILIHLGDLTLASGQEDHWTRTYAMSSKHLKKWLVLGNHDRKSDSWYLDRGFDMVCESFEVHKFGLDLKFSHQPIEGHMTGVNVHGHLHTREGEVESGFDVFKTRHHCLVECENTLGPIKLHTLLTKGRYIP